MTDAKITVDTEVLVYRGPNDVVVVDGEVRERGSFGITLPRDYVVQETWRIVDTDNFGGDYPNEHFVAVGIRSEAEAQRFADVANTDRFLKVVKHIEIAYVLGEP